MAKNSLTLQINSLEALEKLIGGDTQVELDIRNNIVQAFAEKHLKAVAGTQQVNNAIANIRASIEQEVRAECTRSFGDYSNVWNRQIKLDDKIKSVIKQEVLTQIQSIIDSYLKEIVSSPEWIKEKLEKQIKQLILNIVNSELQVKISDAVKSKIDEQVKNLKLTFGISKE